MAFNDYITREEMGALVAKGEAVLYKGRVITSQDELPSKMELAGDNEDDQKVAQSEMEAEIKRQQAYLEASKKSAEAASAAKAEAEKSNAKEPAAASDKK